MAEIQIAQALLFDREDRLLIYLRDNKPEIPFPNRWDFFGGHVEPGETAEQALVREVREELGVQLHSWQLFRIYECTSGDAYPNTKFIYRAQIDKTAGELTLYERTATREYRVRRARGFSFCQYSRSDSRRFYRRRRVAVICG